MHFITVVHAKFEIIPASCLFTHGHYFGWKEVKQRPGTLFF